MWQSPNPIQTKYIPQHIQPARWLLAYCDTYKAGLNPELSCTRETRKCTPFITQPPITNLTARDEAASDQPNCHQT